jgi:hypothetical protein
VFKVGYSFPGRSGLKHCERASPAIVSYNESMATKKLVSPALTEPIIVTTDWLGFDNSANTVKVLASLSEWVLHSASELVGS